jgi:hypothetical protein
MIDAMTWALSWYWLPLVGVIGWVLGVVSDRLLERRPPPTPWAERTHRDWLERERWTR